MTAYYLLHILVLVLPGSPRIRGNSQPIFLFHLAASLPFPCSHLASLKNGRNSLAQQFHFWKHILDQPSHNTQAHNLDTFYRISPLKYSQRPRPRRYLWGTFISLILYLMVFECLCPGYITFIRKIIRTFWMSTTLCLYPISNPMLWILLLRWCSDLTNHAPLPPMLRISQIWTDQFQDLADWLNFLTLLQHCPIFHKPVSSETLIGSCHCQIQVPSVASHYLLMSELLTSYGKPGEYNSNIFFQPFLSIYLPL